MGKFYEGLYEDLSLYVRQGAWLNAVPERSGNDKSNAPLLSRLQKMRDDKEDDGYSPEMPPIAGAWHLIGYLFEVGPTMASGMGAGSITHVELRAWQLNIGIELHPWEVRFLMRLSNDYVAESSKAEKPGCPAPWQPKDYVPDYSAVAKSMQQSIIEMANL